MQQHKQVGMAGGIGPTEELITLTEATGHLPRVDGKKVAVCTLWRWCRRGLPTPAQERARLAPVAFGLAALPTFTRPRRPRANVGQTGRC